ncbi:MAG: hypothetical protein J7L71_02915 [Spirochaetaceae bacterium]|nr:hypothetical protein [Spirochaetaceae bacterium]
MAETKNLKIPKLQFTEPCPDLGQISKSIEEHGTKIKISEVNWPDYSYKPGVILYCAYTRKEILLKYCVSEKYILARHSTVNSPVYEDSCVEFFISAAKGSYYNFEFNCIGTVNVGYGKQRKGRTLLKDSVLSTVRTYPSLGNSRFELKKADKPWELMIAIPFSIFKENEFLDPVENRFRANFYKCGDKLPVPHFLSWNPILTKEPDFHRSEFFGTVSFNIHPLFC